MEIKPIRNEADYQAALKEIESLITSQPDTADGDRMDVLVTLVEAYEAEHFPIPMPDEAVGPVDSKHSSQSTPSFFRVFLSLSLLAIMLFMPLLASGDWRWAQGWVYAAISIFFFILSRALAMHSHPDFARERMTAGEKEDTKAWDKWLMPFTVILPVVVSLLAGLNHRFGWPPPVPPAWQIAGLLLFLLGDSLATWAMAENAYFSSMVRIQSDRGQQVVSGGPYRIVRHPGYACAILTTFAAGLLLESWWALIPALASVPFHCLRTSLEDRTLQAELPGYREYAQKVRYRLLPGVW